MNLQALGTRVLVKMDERSCDTSGIVIPEAYVQREVTGTVKSVGEYVELIDLEEKVLLRHQSGIELSIDGEQYTIVEEDDILGRIED